MAVLLPKDPRARTGSNLHDKSSLTVAQTSINRPLQRLEREFRRERARLIKKTDLRAAAKLTREVEAKWQRAALSAGSDADRRQALKTQARKELERMLGRSVSGYRAYRTLVRNYLKQRRKFVVQPPGPLGVGGLTVNLGALATPITVDVQEFVAPFPRFDITTGDLQDALAQDSSFILPDSGQLIQNFAFEHDESAWGASSRSVFVDHLASCGVDFTMPQTGRLQVAAEIENIANRLNCSISDNFGFSHSYLAIWVNLFVAFVRSGAPVEYKEVDLILSTLNSEGDDVSRSISDLATFEPYAMGGVTLSALPAGEQLTVLAGAHVRVDSDTDDMDAHVQATYWWRLRKLQLGVI